MSNWINYSYKNVAYVSEQCVFRQIAIDVHELNSKLKYQERMILELKEEVEKLRIVAKILAGTSSSPGQHDDEDEDCEDHRYLPPIRLK